MMMSKSRKKIQVTDFSNILFTALARNLLHNDVQESLVLSQSILDATRSILMLSYVYRPVFREKFQDAWHFLARDLKKNPALFAYTFSEILKENYSAFKFLVWCSFISELHFFLSHCQTGNKEEYYIKQCNIVFKDVFDLAFDPAFYNSPQKWIHIFWMAAKIAKKFTLLKPLMNGRTSKETGKLVATCQDSTTGNNENSQLRTVIAIPGSSRKMDMDDNSSERSTHNINEIKFASSPDNFLQVVEPLVYSHQNNQETQVRCLFLDHLMKRCTLGAEPNLERYYDTDDSSPPIESPNVPPRNDFCFSNSKSVKSRKRKSSTSKVLEMYYDTDDSPPPIESPNVPPRNDYCFSNSKSVKSRKRTSSTSKGNSPKRLKK